MLLGAKAWRLREQARQSLERGDGRAALDLASQAQQLCSTRNGERLLVVGRWLSAVAQCNNGKRFEWKSG
jgi:hypothetical protein